MCCRNGRGLGQVWQEEKGGGGVDKEKKVTVRTGERG